ncbi:MAG: hypothetical protein AAF614_42515 [Chloroflexota bacterium]
MKQKINQYHVYMLRIWTQGQEQAQALRLSIEDPRTGQRVGFGTLHELLAFLQQSHASPTTE